MCGGPTSIPDVGFLHNRCIWMVTTVTHQKPSSLARWMRLGSAWWKLPDVVGMKPSLRADQARSCA